MSKIAASVARLERLVHNGTVSPGQQRQVALRVVKQHRRLQYALLNRNNRLAPGACIALALQLHALITIPWVRPHATTSNIQRFHAYTMRTLVRRKRCQECK